MMHACLHIVQGGIRVDPMRLLGMLLWGAACGAGLGAVYDVLRISRLLLGIRPPTPAVQALYRMPLPLLHRPVGMPPVGGRQAVRRAVQGVTVFVQDVCFCLLWGVCMVLLIYYTNDGQFRVLAPLGMLCGMLVYDRTVGRVLRAPAQGIVWLLRAAMCYARAAALLPFRLLAALWRRTVGAWWHRHRAAVCARRAAAFHENTLRTLECLAAQGWLTADAVLLKQKGGWRHAKTEKREKNDPRVAQHEDLSGADRGVCHCLFCDQDDGEQQAQARERGAATAHRRGTARGR